MVQLSQRLTSAREAVRKVACKGLWALPRPLCSVFPSAALGPLELPPSPGEYGLGVSKTQRLFVTALQL